MPDAMTKLLSEKELAERAQTRLALADEWKRPRFRIRVQILSALIDYANEGSPMSEGQWKQLDECITQLADRTQVYPLDIVPLALLLNSFR